MLSDKYRALLFFLGGFVIQVITIFIIGKGIYTGIIIIVPYIVGIIFVIYGIHIAINTFSNWLDGDYSEKIYKKVMAEK